MQPDRHYRPKVSRETRLLLTAAVLALAVLWLLARIRFQGLPATPNPIPAVFSQLSSSPPYDDLAGQLAQIQSRLQPSLLLLGAESVTASQQVAIKLRDDLVVTSAPIASLRAPRKGITLLAHDPASGLAVASAMTAAAMPLALPWTPRRLQQPRYLFAARGGDTGVSLYPVFVGSLTAIDTPLWTGAVWTAPAGTALVPGEFLFSTEAELVGLVIAHGDEPVILPIALLLAEAEQLLSVPPRSGGVVGLEVQALTPSIAAVTGAATGVVVTAVDAGGAGAGGLQVGDVIEAADGRPLSTLLHWRVRVARLAPGDALALRVRRGGEVRDVTLVATAPAVAPVSTQLGLSLRVRTKVGAEITRVDRGSVADRAGLAEGDVITLIASIPAPSPAQVLRAFTATSEGQRVMIAITRGDSHFVTVLER
jgi:S1-C subfamily serine protease